MPRPQKYRQLIRKLRKHDERFEIFIEDGKGSRRSIYHPDIDGEEASYAIKCHGENTEYGKGTLAAIIRRFNLPRKIFG